MKTVEFKVDDGAVFYRCLILIEEDTWLGTNSDGEDMYDSGTVRILRYSDWEPLPMS